MDKLILAPDERLPLSPAPLGGEVEGPFSLLWRGQNRRVWLRAVEMRSKRHMIFASESEESGNWVLYERESQNLAFWSPAPPWRKFQAIRRGWSEGKWALGRFFTVPNSNGKPDQVFRILLGENGVGAWLDRDFRAISRFDFALEQSVFENDRDALKDFLQSELKNSNSKIAFAARWIANRGDRLETLYGNKGAELKQIMRWFLVLEPRIWERGNSWNWHVGPRDENFGFLSCRDAPNFKKFADELPLLFHAGRFLVQDWLPKISAPIRQKYRCTQDFWEIQYVWADIIDATKPTFHEQLEARHKLRQWLEVNAPDQIARLLP